MHYKSSFLLVLRNFGYPITGRQHLSDSKEWQEISPRQLTVKSKSDDVAMREYCLAVFWRENTIVDDYLV